MSKPANPLILENMCPEVATVSPHQGFVLWMTGLSGAGKSTLSAILSRRLREERLAHYVLDGDEIRKGLCQDLGFSPEDRTENIRRIGEVAKLMTNAGLITVVAFISPYRQDRDRARAMLPEGMFVEVFVDCPIEACEKRDPKGLYRKVRDGEIRQFTGISAPYENPLSPEIHLRTDQSPPEECARSLVDYLKENRYI